MSFEEDLKIFPFTFQNSFLYFLKCLSISHIMLDFWLSKY